MSQAAQFEVIAGDFPKGKNNMFTHDVMWMSHSFGAKGTRIPKSQIQTIEIASEESVKRLGGTVGWGVAGAALLGPVGLLAGLLAGGRGKDVTFICIFKDGRKFMATAKSKDYTKIRAAMF